MYIFNLDLISVCHGHSTLLISSVKIYRYTLYCGGSFEYVSCITTHKVPKRYISRNVLLILEHPLHIWSFSLKELKALSNFKENFEKKKVTVILHMRCLRVS